MAATSFWSGLFSSTRLYAREVAAALYGYQRALHARCFVIVSYARLAGYEDVNNQEALTRDPAMRAVVGKKALDRNAASSQTVSRFETEILTREENIEALSTMNSAWVEKAVSSTQNKKVILDMDSSEFPVHGNQEGSAWNGHFNSRCYHPLFVFNQFGDCEGATLRPGNVHSADGWRTLLEPIVDRYKPAFLISNRKECDLELLKYAV
jgi:hypothetical protein